MLRLNRDVALREMGDAGFAIRILWIPYLVSRI